MNLDIINMKGEKVGVYELPDTALELEKGSQAVKDTVVSFLNACRAGTASTKTRGQVSGGGRKPFKQKGLGRARSGSSRNASWRHGGVAFGPTPRSFATKINSKVRRLALQRSFSESVKNSGVIVVDDIKFESPKTKEAVSAFNAMKATGKILCVVADYEENSILATSNLPAVCLMKASAVNTYQVLWADMLVCSKDAMDVIVKRIEKVTK
jgi:large subunit ribosomal protein L4